MLNIIRSDQTGREVGIKLLTKMNDDPAVVGGDIIIAIGARDCQVYIFKDTPQDSLDRLAEEVKTIISEGGSDE